MLTSKCLKNVLVGYPLKIMVSLYEISQMTCANDTTVHIQAREIKEMRVDYNEEFIQRILQKMDWNALSEAARTVCCIRKPWKCVLTISFDTA